MPDGQMRFGDGPWFTVHDAKVTLRPDRNSTDATDALLYAASGLIERRAEDERLRGLGVDPGRVIDGETVTAADRCEACRQQRDPYVHFTAGGFVCEDCAMYLPLGCQRCGHHFSYVDNGVCKCSVGRIKADGMWYGPCGCCDFVAPEKLPPLPPALVARINGAQKEIEND